MKVDLSWQEWKCVLRLAQLGVKSLGDGWSRNEVSTVEELRVQVEKVK